MRIACERSFLLVQILLLVKGWTSMKVVYHYAQTLENSNFYLGDIIIYYF